MSEKSQEILLYSLGMSNTYDADERELEARYKAAFYKSSKIDIQEQLNKEDFKNVWLVLRPDIEKRDIDLQRIFAQQTLDKISEVYDFEFPYKITLDLQYEIDDFYDFLEFLEYDNEKFILGVWKFLNPTNLLKLNIKEFCETNSNKVIKEIDEQLQIHPQSRLVSLFLRTYYKEKIIEWFINRTERRKVDITVQILQEGSLKNA